MGLNGVFILAHQLRFVPLVASRFALWVILWHYWWDRKYLLFYISEFRTSFMMTLLAVSKILWRVVYFYSFYWLIFYGLTPDGIYYIYFRINQSNIPSFVLVQHTAWILIMLVHRSNSSQAHADIFYFDSEPTSRYLNLSKIPRAWRSSSEYQFLKSLVWLGRGSNLQWHRKRDKVVKVSNL